jgi:N-acetyl-gamma-glutamyl-phosphate reductase
MKDSINIAIAGATGYVGLELIKILNKHPKVKILYLCATKSIGKNIKIFDKKLSKRNIPKITSIENIKWKKINIIFTALPNGEAQKIALNLPKHVKLIDLSGDFRLKNSALYKKWYGINHKSKKLIKDSIYSIPEFAKGRLKKYKIISCPGCYPTSIQLPLIPLINKKMINVRNIIVDSKSGYSGGGKNVENKFKNINIFNTVSAYGVGSHKHMAEIDQELSKVAKKKVKVIFTPHLIPMFRGILSTIYLEVNKKYNANKIYSFLKKYHKGNYFIKIKKFNNTLSTDSVINTNCCNIAICKSNKKNQIIIISAIDNLIKGASGQAVQNMNIAYNFKETLGLI